MTTVSSEAWAVAAQSGTVAELHRRSGATLDGERTGRTVTFWRPSAPAIVLGSAQPDSVIVEPAAVPVVRRRSGGGAVYVAPGEMVWADVVVPSGDALWRDDVGQACWWLGEAWSRALATVGLAPASLSVHRGRLVKSRWSGMACFAGLGPGEVLLDGRKVVGIAQRRNRNGALFQCAALLVWYPDALLSTFALDAADRAEATAELSAMVTTVPVAAEVLKTAFVGALPVEVEL